MQSFTPAIPGSQNVKDSRAPLVANDNTVLSNSEGTGFPTGAVVVVGMTCYRSDQNKLYQCKDLTGTAGGPTWVLIADLSKTYLPQETGDTRYAPNGAAGFKNLVFGGDFSSNPWQRGGGAFVLNSSINRMADRWCATRANQGSQYTINKVATSDLNYPSALRLVRASTDTVTNAAVVAHNMESADIHNYLGKTVTLAVRGKKAVLTGTCTLALVYGTGTDQNALTGLTGQTTIASIDLQAAFTTSYGEAFVSGVVPSTATQLAVVLTHTPGVSGGVVESVDLEIVQLADSPIFTGFERRPFVFEANAYRRFLPFYNGASGVTGMTAAISTTTAHVHIPFTTPTRVAPTGITISNGAHFGVRDRTGTINPTTALSFVDASVFGCTLLATIGTAAFTVGDSGTFVMDNASAKIFVSGAEL